MKTPIKNVLITRTIAAGAGFTEDINIDFPVGKIILKGISWGDNTSVGKSAKIISPLFGYQAIVAFPAITSGYYQYEIEFTPNGPSQENIRGSYSFNFINIAGTTANVSGDIGIHLEFIGKE